MQRRRPWALHGFGVTLDQGLDGRLERLYALAEAMYAEAVAAGHGTQALNLPKEMRGQLETIGRATGQYVDRAVTVANLLSNPEIHAARNVIYEELRDQPELRQRIAARLQPERLTLEAPR
jgi:hypothetical protein